MSLDMTISDAGSHSLHNQWLGHRYLTLHLIPILNIVNPAACSEDQQQRSGDQISSRA